MATFHLYNYQFGKLGSEEEPDLFGNKTLSELADENFPRRQEILDNLLAEDYQKTSQIVFSNATQSREYAHIHLMPPTDNISILKIANRKTLNITNIKFEEKKEYDYANCLFVIDNREGIQRIAIEQNRNIFREVRFLANIFQVTLNRLLKPYGLHIELYNLQDSADFWRCVNDKKEYPKGFYKLIFKLPHLNLDRLTKKIDKIATMARQSYDSDMTIEMKAKQGGCLNLSEKDNLQQAQVSYMTDDLGGESIILVPVEDKSKRIYIGKQSQKTTTIPNAVFTQIAEDASGNNLLASDAFDKVKQNTTIGI